MKILKIISLTFAALAGLICVIPIILLLIVEWALDVIGHGFISAGDKVEKFTDAILELYEVIAQKIKQGWDSV